MYTHTKCGAQPAWCTSKLGFESSYNRQENSVDLLVQGTLSIHGWLEVTFEVTFDQVFQHISRRLHASWLTNFLKISIWDFTLHGWPTWSKSPNLGSTNLYPSGVHHDITLPDRLESWAYSRITDIKVTSLRHVWCTQRGHVATPGQCDPARTYGHCHTKRGQRLYSAEWQDRIQPRHHLCIPRFNHGRSHSVGLVRLKLWDTGDIIVWILNGWIS